MPFSNPIIAGDEGALIRNSIQSPDYVQGVSGWSINRDGSAEFNDVTVRGTVYLQDLFAGNPAGAHVEINGATGLITVVGTNGMKMEIVPSNINPEIRFYSQDGTQYAYINQPEISPTFPSLASLGANSGIYTPADGTPRRHRMFLNTDGPARLETVRASDQFTYGGYFQAWPVSAFFGYNNPNAPVIQNYLRANPNGFLMVSPNNAEQHVSTTTTVSVNNATFTAFDANCNLVFTAPPSGAGVINYKIRNSPGAAGQRTYGAPQIRTGATPGSGTIVSAAVDNESVHLTAANAGDLWEFSNYIDVSGLTAGSVYNIQLMLRCTMVATPASVTFRGMRWEPDLG